MVCFLLPNKTACTLPVLLSTTPKSLPIAIVPVDLSVWTALPIKTSPSGMVTCRLSCCMFCVYAIETGSPELRTMPFIVPAQALRNRHKMSNKLDGKEPDKAETLRNFIMLKFPCVKSKTTTKVSLGSRGVDFRLVNGAAYLLALLYFAASPTIGREGNVIDDGLTLS